MNSNLKYLQRCLLLFVLLSFDLRAEDIDIFAGTKQIDTSLPNVVFVLDNTSNWSRKSQGWPGGIVQGQSEVRAIKTALAAQVGKLNVGIVEYSTTGSNAQNDGAFVRFDLQELTATSQTELNAVLDMIYGDIDGTTEKRDSSNLYGYLTYDFYNYLKGDNQSKGGDGTPTTIADPDAYSSQWDKFQSPLEAEDACADTYLIFIGNNTNGDIAGDDATNSTALKALYTAAGETAPDALAGDTGGTPLAMPGFACTTVQGPDVVITPEIPGYWETVTTPGATHPAETGKVLGNSLACYLSSDASATDTAAAVAACTTAEAARVDGPCNVSPNPPNAPVPTTNTCSCSSAPTSSTSGCFTGNPKKDRTYHLQVTGNIAAYTEPDTTTQVWHPPVPAVTEPGDISTICSTSGQSNTTEGKDYNFDDWAKFLHNYGIPLTFTVDSETFEQRVKVTTYAIDVFNKQQSPELSGVWFSAANAGGGRYFQAKSEDQILAAINSAIGDILSVNSAFAAVTLPLSANNSSRRDNQVYIGMFRPSPGQSPRWFGNLKRYQLALFNGELDLADVNLRRAINPLTGFAAECAESYWSYDTDTYWENLGINPPPLGTCNLSSAAGKQWSDLPDGPFVEKGAVAQVTRFGPAGSARPLYTVKSNALGLITDSEAASLGGQTVLDYFRGDSAGTDEVMPATGLRASVHGDVVHSRPVTVRYDDDSVIIYYGTNDGLFRAVDSSDGSEKWAFLAPEHYSKIQRLHDNTPLVHYEGATEDGAFTYTNKDYFFDGSTGLMATYELPDDPDSAELGDLQSAYIYPIMRRGGRMVYGLDVTNPNAPSLMWRSGCPNLDNDSGCTTGFTDIGQTWSTPVGMHAYGYPDSASGGSLLMFGGGFDDCLDTDQSAYPTACNSAKGKGVYIVDAVSGTLVEYFDTDAPVMTDVSPIDVNFDGLVDFAYVADAAGNLYRIRFADLTMDLMGLPDVPDAAIVSRDNTSGKEWLIEKIASIPGTQRRFFNSPTAGLFQGTIFVTIGSGDREHPLETNYPYVDDVQNRFFVLADSPYQDYIAEQNAEGTYTRRVVNLEGDTMFEVGDEFPEDQDLRNFDGWFMDMADRGEQIANPSAIGGGKVLFNSFQPGGVSNGICEQPLGIGTNYAVDLFNPQPTEGSNCAGGGFCIPPVIDVVEGVAEGCEEGAECWYKKPECPPEKPNCETPPPCADPDSPGCSNVTACIQGGFEVCKLDPAIDPTRARTYFTEKNIDQ